MTEEVKLFLSSENYGQYFGGILEGFSLPGFSAGLESTSPDTQAFRDLVRLVDRFLEQLDVSVLKGHQDLLEYSGSEVLIRLASEESAEIVMGPPLYYFTREVILTVAQFGRPAFLDYLLKRERVTFDLDTKQNEEALDLLFRIVLVAFCYSNTSIIEHLYEQTQGGPTNILVDNNLSAVLHSRREVKWFLDLLRQYPNEDAYLVFTPAHILYLQLEEIREYDDILLPFFVDALGYYHRYYENTVMCYEDVKMSRLIQYFPVKVLLAGLLEAEVVNVENVQYILQHRPEVFEQVFVEGKEFQVEHGNILTVLKTLEQIRQFLETVHIDETLQFEMVDR
jgi:hypothetical protein